MQPEGGPRDVPIHATAVAIDGRALVIRGRSGAGKSALAAALVASSARRATLIGDDRVLLRALGSGDVSVRPHPRIAGFIERRGLGFVAMPFAAEAPVAGLVDLGHATSKSECLENFPVLRFVEDEDVERRRDRVWAWWAGLPSAADGSHVPAKVALTLSGCAKNYLR